MASLDRWRSKGLLRKRRRGQSPFYRIGWIAVASAALWGNETVSKVNFREQHGSSLGGASYDFECATNLVRGYRPLIVGNEDSLVGPVHPLEAVDITFAPYDRTIGG